MALVPKVQWAQRADKLYITIDLQDAKDPKVNISNDAEGKFGKISFRGEGRSHATGLEKHEYALDLDLLKGVNPEESKISVSDRSIFLVVIKADDAQEHWPRLLQGKGKVTNVTVDWNKWVDEDEEEEGKKDDFDMSDLQNFQNFGGGAFGGGLGGGMSGIGNVEAVQDDGDDSDDDDDDMPPLEEEEK
ncbi:probable co-chaperone protein p23-1 [Coccomyxa sp. Obi]|nr:probable co-chaperone protein p23-1 [Coccomyxa sp. Obi]